MNTFSERLSAWNRSMNDIPRRFMIIVLVVLCCYAAVQLFPYCWPFVIALLFASILEPVARLLRKALKKLRAARIIATLLCMALLFGLLTFAFFGITGRVFREAINLINAVPGFARNVYNAIINWLGELYAEYGYLLPEDFQLTNISDYLSTVLDSIVSKATSLAGTAASFTLSTVTSTVTSLPMILLSIVFIIMGTFYFSYDRERISGYFRNAFPSPVVKNFRLIKNGVFSAMFGQIRAQIFISFVLTLIIIFGLIILKQPYALLLGIIIGIGDVLPVVGAGLFLNTWAVVDLLLGNYSTALGLFIIYLCTVTVRQIIEPRIVGKQLGLYPLVTMASMFAGFQLIGTLGLIAGPLVANICRVALDADAGRLGGPKQPTAFALYLEKIKARIFKKKTAAKPKK